MSKQSDLKGSTASGAIPPNNRKVYVTVLACNSLLVEVIPPLENKRAQLFDETKKAALYAKGLELETGYPVVSQTIFEN